MARLIALAAAASLVVLSAGATQGAPENDALSRSLEITSLPFEIDLDTTGASSEDVHLLRGECVDRHAVWYSLTASRDGRALIDLRASTYQVGVVVFAGADPTTAPRLGCLRTPRSTANPTEARFGRGQILFNLAEDQTYLIAFAACRNCGSSAATTGTLRASIRLIPQIRGSALDCAGNSLEGVSVRPVSSQADLPQRTSNVGSKGSYALDVEPGTYRLRFIHRADGGTVRWYPDALGYNMAEDVTVAEGEIVDGIDIRLPVGEACQEPERLQSERWLFVLAALPGILALFLLAARRRPRG